MNIKFLHCPGKPEISGHCTRSLSTVIFILCREKKKQVKVTCPQSSNRSAAAPGTKFLSFKFLLWSHADMNSWWNMSKCWILFWLNSLFSFYEDKYSLQKEASMWLNCGKYLNCLFKLSKSKALSSTWGEGRTWPSQNIGSSVYIGQWHRFS